MDVSVESLSYGMTAFTKSALVALEKREQEDLMKKLREGGGRRGGKAGHKKPRTLSPLSSTAELLNSIGERQQREHPVHTIDVNSGEMIPMMSSTPNDRFLKSKTTTRPKKLQAKTPPPRLAAIDHQGKTKKGKHNASTGDDLEEISEKNWSQIKGEAAALRSQMGELVVAEPAPLPARPLRRTHQDTYHHQYHLSKKQETIRRLEQERLVAAEKAKLEVQKEAASKERRLERQYRSKLAGFDKVETKLGIEKDTLDAHHDELHGQGPLSAFEDLQLEGNEPVPALPGDRVVLRPWRHVEQLYAVDGSVIPEGLEEMSGEVGSVLANTGRPEIVVVKFGAESDPFHLFRGAIIVQTHGVEEAVPDAPTVVTQDGSILDLEDLDVIVEIVGETAILNHTTTWRYPTRIDDDSQELLLRLPTPAGTIVTAVTADNAGQRIRPIVLQVDDGAQVVADAADARDKKMQHIMRYESSPNMKASATSASPHGDGSTDKGSTDQGSPLAPNASPPASHSPGQKLQQPQSSKSMSLTPKVTPNASPSGYSMSKSPAGENIPSSGSVQSKSLAARDGGSLASTMNLGTGLGEQPTPLGHSLAHEASASRMRSYGVWRDNADVAAGSGENGVTLVPLMEAGRGQTVTVTARIEVPLMHVPGPVRGTTVFEFSYPSTYAEKYLPQNFEEIAKLQFVILGMSNRGIHLNTCPATKLNRVTAFAGTRPLYVTASRSGPWGTGSIRATFQLDHQEEMQVSLFVESNPVNPRCDTFMCLITPPSHASALLAGQQVPSAGASERFGRIVSLLIDVPAGSGRLLEDIEATLLELIDTLAPSDFLCVTALSGTELWVMGYDPGDEFAAERQATEMIADTPAASEPSTGEPNMDAAALFRGCFRPVDSVQNLKKDALSFVRGFAQEMVPMFSSLVEFMQVQQTAMNAVARSRIDMKVMKQADALREVVVLSGGSSVPLEHQQLMGLINKTNHGIVRFHAVLAVPHWTPTAYFWCGLAGKTRGNFVMCQRYATRLKQMLGFVHRIGHPLLADLEVSFPQGQHSSVDVWGPGRMDLTAGNTMIVCGSHQYGHDGPGDAFSVSLRTSTSKRISKRITYSKISLPLMKGMHRNYLRHFTSWTWLAAMIRRSFQFDARAILNSAAQYQQPFSVPREMAEFVPMTDMEMSILSSGSGEGSHANSRRGSMMPPAVMVESVSGSGGSGSVSVGRRFSMQRGSLSVHANQLEKMMMMRSPKNASGGPSRSESIFGQLERTESTWPAERGASSVNLYLFQANIEKEKALPFPPITTVTVTSTNPPAGRTWFDYNRKRLKSEMTNAGLFAAVANILEGADPTHAAPGGNTPPPNNSIISPLLGFSPTDPKYEPPPALTAGATIPDADETRVFRTPTSPAPHPTTEPPTPAQTKAAKPPMSVFTSEEDLLPAESTEDVEGTELVTPQSKALEMALWIGEQERTYCEAVAALEEEEYQTRNDVEKEEWRVHLDDLHRFHVTRIQVLVGSVQMLRRLAKLEEEERIGRRTIVSDEQSNWEEFFIETEHTRNVMARVNLFAEEGRKRLAYFEEDARAEMLAEQAQIWRFVSMVRVSSAAATTQDIRFINTVIDTFHHDVDKMRLVVAVLAAWTANETNCAVFGLEGGVLRLKSLLSAFALHESIVESLMVAIGNFSNVRTNHGRLESNNVLLDVMHAAARHETSFGVQSAAMRSCSTLSLISVSFRNVLIGSTKGLEALLVSFPHHLHSRQYCFHLFNLCASLATEATSHRRIAELGLIPMTTATLVIHANDETLRMTYLKTLGLISSSRPIRMTIANTPQALSVIAATLDKPRAAHCKLQAKALWCIDRIAGNVGDYPCNAIASCLAPALRNFLELCALQQRKSLSKQRRRSSSQSAMASPNPGNARTSFSGVTSPPRAPSIASPMAGNVTPSSFASSPKAAAKSKDNRTVAAMMPLFPDPKLVEHCYRLLDRLTIQAVPKTADVEPTLRPMYRQWNAVVQQAFGDDDNVEAIPSTYGTLQGATLDVGGDGPVRCIARSFSKTELEDFVITRNAETEAEEQTELEEGAWKLYSAMVSVQLQDVLDNTLVRHPAQLRCYGFAMSPERVHLTLYAMPPKSLNHWLQELLQDGKSLLLAAFLQLAVTLFDVCVFHGHCNQTHGCMEVGNIYCEEDPSETVPEFIVGPSSGLSRELVQSIPDNQVALDIVELEAIATKKPIDDAKDVRHTLLDVLNYGDALQGDPDAILSRIPKQLADSLFALKPRAIEHNPHPREGSNDASQELSAGSRSDSSGVEEDEIFNLSPDEARNVVYHFLGDLATNDMMGEVIEAPDA